MEITNSNKIGAKGAVAPVESHEVLVGAKHPVSLDTCAQRLMTRAGLTCLLDTNRAFRGDPGTEIDLTINPVSLEVSFVGPLPEKAAFVVAEQPQGGALCRGRAFETPEGAAAHFGVKLVLQEAGSFYVEQSDRAGPPDRVVFNSTGKSELSSLVMLTLAA